MQTINGKGILLVKEMEGLRLTAYKDIAGIYTIGFGSTGPHVHEGMVITEPEANALLRSDLLRFEVAVSNMVTSPITQNMFDSLCVFSFNLGSNALKNSTLLKKVNANPNDPNIEQEFLRWNKARVKGALIEVEGLTRRRKKEWELYHSP